MTKNETNEHIHNSFYLKGFEEKQREIELLGFPYDGLDGIHTRLCHQWYCEESKKFFSIKGYQSVCFSEWVKDHPEYEDWLKQTNEYKRRL